MYYIIDNDKLVAKLDNAADVAMYVFAKEIPLKTLAIIIGKDVEVFLKITEE